MKELEDHIFALFSHLEDSDSKELVDAVCFFSSQMNFDIEELPLTLYKAVSEQIKKASVEGYA